MLPKKNDASYETTRKLTVVAPRFAGGDGKPADRPTGTVGSLNPTGVNASGHPRGEGGTTQPEARMAFSLIDAALERPWETVGRRMINDYQELIVHRTSKGHFVVRLKYVHGRLEHIIPCPDKCAVMGVLLRKLNSGTFAEVCWAFLGKVF